MATGRQKNRLFLKIQRDIADTLSTNIVDQAEEIEKEIEKINKFYFFEMKQRVIATESQPDFLSRQIGGGAWKPLEHSTLQKKGHTKFYLGPRGQHRNPSRGAHLRDYLRRIRNGHRKLTREGDVERPFVNIQFGNQDFKSKEQLREAFDTDPDSMPKKGTFQIFPFGKTDPREYAQKKTAMQMFPEHHAHKFYNYKGREDRPLREAYFRWWATEHIPNQLRNRFG